MTILLLGRFRTFPGKTAISPKNELSSRPERTQISYLAALATTTYAAFRRERRTKFASAAKFHRKSGGAERRDLRFLSLGRTFMYGLEARPQEGVFLALKSVWAVR